MNESYYASWTATDMPSPVDQVAAHAELARWLTEERQLLGDLERLLRKEREALQTGSSPEQLEQACEIRQQCMSSLLRLQEERNSWLSQIGFSGDAAGMLQLIRACDTQGDLPPRWAECAALAKRCRELNQQNGALVASRMRRVQGVLDILMGHAADANATYSRSLQNSARAPGRVLRLEA